MKKLQLKKERILALLLACIIPLNYAYNVSAKEKDVSIENTSDTDSRNNSIETRDFFIEMSSIIPLYNWEELYPTMEKIDKILEAAESLTKCENTNADYEALSEIMIDNSIKNSNDSNKLFLPYSIPADNFQIEELTKDHNMRVALKIAIGNICTTSNNLAEDICELSTYTILNGELNENILANCNYETKTITVNYEKILSIFESENLNNNNDLDVIEYLSNILEHELNHCKEHICACREEKGQINETIRFEDTLNFMIESAAESAKYNDSKREYKIFFEDTLDYVYYSERKEEALLFLLAVFKENRIVDDYYQAVFDSDLNSLYRFYGLETKEDIYTFYKITYAMDALYASNDLAYTLYFEHDVQTYGEFVESVGFAYKIDIFKIALKDLMQHIQEHNDLNVEESLFLYNFIKNYIVADSYYRENDMNNFANDIYSLEAIFNDFICNYYNITNNDIENIKSELRYFEAKDLDDRNSINSFNEIIKKIDCNKILIKFPLIKNIFWTYHVYNYDTENFDAQNKDIQVKNRKQM